MEELDRDAEDTQPFKREELDELIKRSSPPPAWDSGSVVILDDDGDID